MFVPLFNSPRDYAWGSPTLIAQLQGRVPTGSPEAEVWFGDHPGCPARVGDGTGRTLDRVRADAGQSPLRFLVKLLAAASPLSIQAHPSRAQAQVGFAREEADAIPRDAAERTYRDDNHKPEVILAVSSVFRALAGLRPLAQTRRLLHSLGDGPGPRALARRLAGDDEAAALRDAIAWLLSGDAQAEVDGIVAAVAEADDAEFARELETLRSIAAAYPGDPGVVVALLMNLVDLRRGQALFVPAGVLHAYLSGLGVEVMAASDNVLRGGLTPKHIDVDELLAILDTAPQTPPILEPRTIAPGIEVFDPGIGDFTLSRVRVDGSGSRELPLQSAAIVLSTTGGVTVTAGEQRQDLPAGTAAYIDGEPLLSISRSDSGSVSGSGSGSGSGEVYLAQSAH